MDGEDATPPPPSHGSMEWHHPDHWLTKALGPHPEAIFITLIICLFVPILLHHYLYRKQASKSPPTLLLLGPSGAGKTSLLTLLDRGKPAQTHTSQTPSTISLHLPTLYTAHSTRFRSTADPAKVHPRFLLTDTPGHGKLRHFALSELSDAKSLRGIVFLIDSAALSSPAGLSEAATYLYDVLLLLQKRYLSSSKASKGGSDFPVLVAANKLDLFTALPEKLVRRELEVEIERIRESRRAGLKDSGVAMGEDEVLDEEEWLGEGGAGPFSFNQMESVGVQVIVRGGSVRGQEGDGPDVGQWWEWVAEQL